MTNLDMLQIVADALGDLRETVVFVGGAVVSLYLTDPGAAEIRPTDDVDCIVELVGHGDLAAIETALRSRGFTNDMSKGAPICRWLLQGIKVDIMPTDPAILGFSNRWYPSGIRHKIAVVLPSKTEIFILPASFFVGTKLEAFLNPDRKFAGDFRFSHDLEDVIAVLDGRRGLEQEFAATPPDLRQYLATRFGAFLKEDGFLEAVEGFFPAATGSMTRQRRLLGLAQRFAQAG